MTTRIRFTKVPTWLLSLLLIIPASILYSQFLWSPVVFDDIYFFDGSIHKQYLHQLFSLDSRWLPYASFEWTHQLLGLDLIWYHLGNLAIHLITTVTLFLFLKRLFNYVLPDNIYSTETHRLSTDWLAFLGALIFSMHPVAVYAVGYLSQRSTLMATLFALLTWRLFLEGILREKQAWLIASAATYFVAVHCKEHAIMVPAVSAALIVLCSNVTRKKIISVIPIFVLYAVIGVMVIAQVKAGHVLGQAYEPIAKDMLPRMEFDPSLAYPLSALTQTYLFFKYLLLWLIPVSSWMSVDMYQHFALKLESFPEVLGFAGFIIYPVIAIRLLMKRGILGLLGFALICPWLLFATELSTVRIQESFVLYRSYLWMPCLFASFPFIFQKLNAQRVVIYLSLVVLFIVVQSMFRLQTFSHPLLLWDDAIRLVEKNQIYRPGVERIYYNRGNNWAELKKYQNAIDDQTKAIELSGSNSYYTGYAYQNRGAAYLNLQNYPKALADFKQSSELQPSNPKAYLGIAKTLEGLQDPGAKQAYELACQKGSQAACNMLEADHQIVNEGIQ